VFSNSTIHNTADNALNARVIAGICLEMVDGGWLEGVVVSGICMQCTRTPIFLRLGARTPPPAGNRTYMRGVMISDVYATGAVLTNSITGIPGLPVEDVTLSNVQLESQEPGRLGRLLAYGIYVRHALGVRMRDVVFKASPTEQRPAVVCDDATSVEVAGLRSRHTARSHPWFRCGSRPRSGYARGKSHTAHQAWLMRPESDPPTSW